MSNFMNFMQIFVYNNLCFFLFFGIMKTISCIEENILNSNTAFFYLYLISYQLIFSLITYFIYF